ncbi:MAG: hypothetical protein AVDCRST_MAG93-7483, partial [uncultured Chloroflexia bacterium]
MTNPEQKAAEQASEAMADYVPTLEQLGLGREPLPSPDLVWEEQFVEVGFADRFAGLAQAVRALEPAEWSIESARPGADGWAVGEVIASAKVSIHGPRLNYIITLDPDLKHWHHAIVEEEDFESLWPMAAPRGVVIPVDFAREWMRARRRELTKVEEPVERRAAEALQQALLRQVAEQ